MCRRPWQLHRPLQKAHFLERPEMALEFYNSRGVTDLVVEEKHMGSRAIFVFAKDKDVAEKRFGVEDGKAGVIYTRTGRPFFKDEKEEAAVIDRMIAAMDKSCLWQELKTDWIVFDAELMPWSAKAQELLQRQYHPTHTAARTSAEALLDAINTSQSVRGSIRTERTSRETFIKCNQHGGNH